MRKDLRQLPRLVDVKLGCEEPLKIKKIRRAVVTICLEYFKIFCDEINFFVLLLYVTFLL